MEKVYTNPIADSYNLLLIDTKNIQHLEKLKNNDYVGLLYGIPIVLRYIGVENSTIQSNISRLSKYSNPNLSINYGISIIEENQEKKVYIVRDLIKGKNFYYAKEISEHNKIVVVYKIICALEFVHSFGEYYTFLNPKKIVFTDDLNVKVIDFIKDDELIKNKISKSSLNTEMRFYHPNIFDENKRLKQLYTCETDIYSIGCLIYYAVYKQLPWKDLSSKEDILKNYNDNKCFYEPTSEINTEEKNIPSIILSCLKGSYNNITELRSDFDDLKEIKDYIDNDVIDIDYDKGKLNVKLI